MSKIYNQKKNYYVRKKNGVITVKMASDARIFGEDFSEIPKEAYDALDINREREIAERKARLSETDYVACKIAEGAATKEDYADVLLEREKLRVEIRALMEGGEAT